MSHNNASVLPSAVASASNAPPSSLTYHRAWSPNPQPQAEQPEPRVRACGGGGDDADDASVASAPASCEVRTFTGNAVASHVLTHMLMAADPLFDVTVHVGGKEFQCHRAVLAASSPVFLAMFRSSMLEPQTGILKLPPDVSASVFHAIRAFLYGQPLKVKSDDAISMSTFVRRYDIASRELEPFFDNLLASALTLDNVIQIRSHADVHSAHRLRRACDRFITARMHLLPFSRPFLDATPHDAEASLQAPSRVARDSVPPRCAERVFSAAVAWLNEDEAPRKCFLDRILNTVPLDQLSLPALVRASRDPIVSASQAFQSKLLRAFALSAERCIAFAPAAAIPCATPDRDDDISSSTSILAASKSFQRSALTRLNERHSSDLSFDDYTPPNDGTDDKYQHLYRYRHAAAIASRLHHHHHFHHHQTRSSPIDCLQSTSSSSPVVRPTLTNVRRRNSNSNASALVHPRFPREPSSSSISPSTTASTPASASASTSASVSTSIDPQQNYPSTNP